MNEFDYMIIAFMTLALFVAGAIITLLYESSVYWKETAMAYRENWKRESHRYQQLHRRLQLDHSKLVLGHPIRKETSQRSSLEATGGANHE